MSQALRAIEESGAASWAGVSAVETMISHESLVCLRQDLRSEDVSSAAPILSGPIYGHRLGVILIVGPALRVTLKVFFNTEDVQKVLSTKIGRAPEDLTRNNLDDYVKELLNRVAGAAKRNLGECGISAGISLPIITRGFDEVFRSSSRGNLEKIESWVLRYGNVALTFSSAVVVLNAQELSRYTFTPSAEEAEDDMEFL